MRTLSIATLPFVLAAAGLAQSPYPDLTKPPTTGWTDIATSRCGGVTDEPDLGDQRTVYFDSYSSCTESQGIITMQDFAWDETDTEIVIGVSQDYAVVNSNGASLATCGLYVEGSGTAPQHPAVALVAGHDEAKYGVIIRRYSSRLNVFNIYTSFSIKHNDVQPVAHGPITFYKVKLDDNGYSYWYISKDGWSWEKIADLLIDTYFGTGETDFGIGLIGENGANAPVGCTIFHMSGL